MNFRRRAARGSPAHNLHTKNNSLVGHELFQPSMSFRESVYGVKLLNQKEGIDELYKRVALVVGKGKLIFM